MVSLRELGGSNFTLHWHEAVALVSETAAVLLADGIVSVPDPESVVLAPDGTVHLVHEGPPHPAPAQRLGAMLEGLLSSTASPPELRRLMDESMADPPAYATIEDFTGALAFFERPGRHELLTAVAARASEMELEARANTELERLQARTRKQESPPRPERRPDGTRPRRRPVVLVVAGSLLVGAAAIGALAVFRATDSEARTHGVPATLVERVRARVDGITQKGLEAIGLRAPNPTPPSTPAVTAPNVARKPARRTPKPLPVTISVKELTSGPISPPSAAIVSESPAPAVLDEAIYTAEAEGVAPAVLMRQQLPSRPPDDASPEEIGMLEIVVSATGVVEQVRLTSGSTRFQDRMIIAAAKAWRFEPAKKNGQPVRYRTRIRITL